MKIVNYLFITSVSLILLALVIGVLNFLSTDGLLIVQVDQFRNVTLGSTFDFLMIIIFTSLIVAVNFLLSKYLSKKESFFGLLLAVGSTFCSLLILITTFAIISLN